MNNQQYIAALKRALSGMSRASREDILREIESSLEEMPDADSQSLESRFGPVEDLARQYLDGESLPPSLGSRFGNTGRATLLFIGGATLALVCALTAMAWLFSGDKFDYADETALQREVADGDWSSLQWSDPVELQIEQAHAVIYWHDTAQLRWHCKGRDQPQPVPGRPIKLRHGFCLLFVPEQAISAQVSQSDVVLVRPGASLKLKMVQGELRIAENGNTYRYELDLRDSDSNSLLSDANATTLIAVNAVESSITAYEYR